MKGWRRRGVGVDGGCVELLAPRGASSASPVPQISSQPASRALTSSLSLSLLYFCLLLSRSASLPEALAVPVSPSYANCLSCYQRCMSVWQPLCPPFCLSLFQPVFLLFLQSSCLPACPSACLPASFLLQPIPPQWKASRLSAALPICPTICPSTRHLFVSLFVCPLVYLPVYLSASPSVCCLSRCTAVCVQVKRETKPCLRSVAACEIILQKSDLKHKKEKQRIQQMTGKHQTLKYLQSEGEAEHLSG